MLSAFVKRTINREHWSLILMLLLWPIYRVLTPSYDKSIMIKQMGRMVLCKARGQPMLVGDTDVKGH